MQSLRVCEEDLLPVIRRIDMLGGKLDFAPLLQQMGTLKLDASFLNPLAENIKASQVATVKQMRAEFETLLDSMQQSIISGLLTSSPDAGTRTREIEELKKAKGKVGKEVDELKNANKKIMDGLNANDKEIVELKTANKKIMGGLNANDKEIHELKNANKKIMGGLNANDKEIDELKNANKKIMDDLNATDKEIEELKKAARYQVAPTAEQAPVAEGPEAGKRPFAPDWEVRSDPVTD